MKKILCLILTLACILSALAGCSKDTAGDTQEREITIFAEDNPNMPINNGVPVYDELSKRTNIKFNFELAPIANVAEKFNIMMASNEIPDVVMYSIMPINNYKKAFLPLNDIIKSHENLNTTLMGDDEVRRAITTSDGNIYTIPQISPFKFSLCYIVRQDWLDKLGLEQPKTLDDFYNVLKAFKEQDPNGNGEADEIPFSGRLKRRTLIAFVEAFGLTDNFYVRDGVVNHGLLDPKMPEAIAFLNKLYTEGLVDPEYIVTDVNQWQTQMAKQQVGMTFDWGTRIDYLDTNVEGANFVGIEPPVGPFGEPMTFGQQVKTPGGGSAISKQSKKAEIAAELFDYIYSPEGKDLMNFGIEGTHYTKNGDEYVYSDEIMSGADGKTPQQLRWLQGINGTWSYPKDEKAEVYSDKWNDVRNKYENGIIKETYPIVDFTSDEKMVISEKQSQIQTYIDEMLDKFIMGNEDISTYGEFVNQLKEMGIEELVDIYQQAYDRAQSY